jgi:hypothetical protein
MSEYLVTEKVYPEEAETVEGRLADLMETAVVSIEEYKLSDKDRAKVVAALRAASPALSASEPVAWRWSSELTRGQLDNCEWNFSGAYPKTKSTAKVEPLYTHPAPSVSPSVDAMAEALWRHEVADISAAKNARDRQKFSEQSETAQNKWRGFAQSISALFAQGGKK